MIRCMLKLDKKLVVSILLKLPVFIIQNFILINQLMLIQNIPNQSNLVRLSAFFQFFILHFNQLKLSKLICTGYSGSENNTNGYMVVITKINDSLEEINNNTLPILFSLDGNFIENLDDADFRSNDCMNLLKEADIVVTNPPFSLFREFIKTLINHNKKFIILGNMNTTTCKDIFPLFKNNQVHYRQSLRSGNCKF